MKRLYLLQRRKLRYKDHKLVLKVFFMAKKSLELPRSKFLKVVCNDCGNEQVVFGCAASEVKCQSCGKVLLKPGANKSRILTKISKVLE